MSDTSLEKLHTAFTEALRTHTYVGPAEDDASILKCTKKKDIRLKEVFERALDQIKADLKNDPSPIEDATLLRTLKHDGKAIYECYIHSTNRWSRWFLKCLAYYTPDLLKKFLPACFSNEMEKAEQETVEAFEKYRSFLKEKIEEFRSLRRKEEVEHSDEEEIFDAEREIASEESEKSKTRAKKSAAPKTSTTKAPIDPKKEAELKKLREQRLKAFGGKTAADKEDFPDEEDPEMQQFLLSQLSLQDSKLPQPDSSPARVKKEKVTVDPAIALDNLLKALYENEEDAKVSSTASEDLEKEPLKTTDIYDARIYELSQLLMQQDQRPLGLQKLKNTLESLATVVAQLIDEDPLADSFLEELGIQDKALDTLKDPHFTTALQANDDQKVLELLEATSWHLGFKEALEQKGHITFGIRKILGQPALALSNEEGKPIKESVLPKYRGQIKVDLSVDLLKELLQFLKKNEACRPNSIVIEAKQGTSFTPELFDLLMQLEERVAEVRVEELQEIDFKKLGISEDTELQFVRHLHSFSFPQLENVILSDHAKKEWTTDDFSSLLAVCPTMELLKTCYQQCPSYKDIVVPTVLTEGTEVDVSGYGYSIDQAAHLLSLFSDLTYVDLSGLPYTDSQLYSLLKQANLNNVVELQLESCKGLTTDSLPTLASLPRLRSLALPDLPKGRLPLDELPKFENPFKIQLLYTASKATQPLAASLYTGPQIWTPVFQIPLARQGVANIFTPNQQRLDPKSVAYWLYADDYQHLKPQTSIMTIFADSNSALHDDNLVEFAKKFPKATLISLYNCPHVTDEGIIRLLKACPNIQTLDLRGCRQINESLFFGDGNLTTLKQLKKLFVSDTGISSNIVATFNTADQLGTKLVFEETCLKITDDDLTDDDALEKILEKHTLNELKRIDLEDCVNLNNKMLGQLLDHLNAPEEIETPEKTKIDNPQRLNLAVLNLKGCINITEEAFHNPPPEKSESEDEGEGEETPVKAKIEPKFLGNLDRVITGGTKIADVLKEVYPRVIFQKLEEPVAMEIDPDKQFGECLDYHAKKGLDFLSEDEEKELKHLTQHYLHNLIVIELFCGNNALEVIEQPMDTQSKEFCDMTLSFKTHDEDKELISFQVHRDILYYQSLFFTNKFRPGGTLSKNDCTTLVNVHATAESAPAVIDILYDKPCIQDLDWQTAADVAELIGPKIFKFSSSIYDAVLDRIHSQFDLTNAQELLESAHPERLNDQKGKTEYENTLLVYLDNLGPNDQHIFQAIANIAGGKHGLKRLQAKVAKMQNDKTKKIEREIHEQNVADAAEADAELIEQIVQDDRQYLRGTFLGRLFNI